MGVITMWRKPKALMSLLNALGASRSCSPFMQLVVLLFVLILGNGATWAQAPQAASAEPERPALKVQLPWYHQTQFTGLYMAQVRKFFEAEGLRVILLEGGEGIDPATEVQAGRADIAITWLAHAWARSTPTARLTNVAQIFPTSSLTLVCTKRSGVRELADLATRPIGTWGLGDEVIVKEMLRRANMPSAQIRLVRQRAHAQDLISGALPCATAMNYNEYWRILAAGLSPDELVIFEPGMHGVVHVEDGVYVLSDRLSSPAFQMQLVQFTRALRRGWMEAKREPTLAVEIVNRQSNMPDKDLQRYMLETLLTSLPPESQFGYFDLRRFEAAAAALKTHDRDGLPPEGLWTHLIWNQLSKPTLVTASTQHYVRQVFQSSLSQALVLAGTLAFAFSAALQAIEYGYGLWGRLLIAMTASMGGGAIRDLLIGGDRLPFYFMGNWEYPAGIFVLVLVASLLLKAQRTGQEMPFGRTRQVCETVGFSVIAINGTLVAVMADLAWFWLPFCAAISCTGGGLLQDVLTNREPGALRTTLFEEIAMVTALVLLGGLLLANRFEHTALPVYLTLIACLALSVGLSEWIRRHRPRLPAWIGGRLG